MLEQKKKKTILSSAIKKKLESITHHRLSNSNTQIKEHIIHNFHDLSIIYVDLYVQIIWLFHVQTKIYPMDEDQM